VAQGLPEPGSPLSTTPHGLGQRIGAPIKEAEQDSVVHFEIPTDDAERARRSYGSVFEWKLVPMQGYDWESS
jgi:hypothetical protein